jgi:3-oxoacid CoA-transferase
VLLVQLVCQLSIHLQLMELSVCLTASSRLTKPKDFNQTLVQTGELPVRYNTDGTIAKMAPPKETREFNGKSYVMEEAIFGDYAFVKVAKADRLGNCQFRKAQNNFNEAMGKNAKMTIVEADEIVEDGEIAPEDIHLQGIYVKRVIKSTEEKQIERKVFWKSPEEQKKALLEGGTS